MNACIGSDFAGDVAKSHALFSFNAAYESADTAKDLACAFETFDDVDAKPGGGGKFFHLEEISSVVKSSRVDIVVIYV